MVCPIQYANELKLISNPCTSKQDQSAYRSVSLPSGDEYADLSHVINGQHPAPALMPIKAIQNATSLHFACIVPYRTT